MTRFELSAGGKRYAYWTKARVSVGLAQLAYTFDVELTRPGNGTEDLPFAKGDPCAIYVYGSQLFPGFIRRIRERASAKETSLTLSGRSASSDLAECSAVRKGGSWKGQTILQIAKDLVAPFSLDVRAEVDVGKPFARFAIQDSETVHEALERAARMRGLLLTTDIDGAVVITRASSEVVRTVLRRGENIIEAESNQSDEEQFSHYVVKAQSAGSNSWSGAQAAGGKASVDDDSVKRYRPLIVHAEQGEAGGALKERALWERNVRYGRGLEYTASVRGWLHADGFWERNKLVRVVDPRLRVNETLLIVSVNFTYDADGGELAALTLTRREAFDVEPLVPKPKKGSFI